MNSYLKCTFLTAPELRLIYKKKFLFTQQFLCTCRPVTRHLELNLWTNERQKTREEPTKAILSSSLSLLALDGESRWNMTRWKVITPRHGAFSLTFHLGSFNQEKTFLSQPTAKQATRAKVHSTNRNNLVWLICLRLLQRTITSHCSH